MEHGSTNRRAAVACGGAGRTALGSTDITRRRALAEHGSTTDRRTIPDHRTVPRRAIPRRAIPRRAIPRRAIPRRAIPRRAIPRRAIP
ncbi:hypothetical protein AB0J72_32450, partial [Dactylosporangium sp. NPDC049742]|uniref:hypothetical protein n=1 Tax=Dactylosporangium sp. NPDC049742 TaxID=3154737 RepID=UPI0034211E59